jgi:hypothetical protein
MENNSLQSEHKEFVRPGEHNFMENPGTVSLDNVVDKINGVSEYYRPSPLDLGILEKALAKAEIGTSMALLYGQIEANGEISPAEALRNKITETDREYSFANPHYRQSTAIGCAVSSFMMARSIIEKSYIPTSADEVRSLRELVTPDTGRVELVNLLGYAIQNGINAEIFYSDDPKEKTGDDFFDRLKANYLKGIEGLTKEYPGFLEQKNGANIDEELIRNILKTGRPILINGVVTPRGELHARLISGYNAEGLVIDDPLLNNKITMSWKDLLEVSTTPTGVWMVALDYHKSEVTERQPEGDNFEKTMIPYNYLGSKAFKLEIDPYDIPEKVISPAVRDMVRSGRKPKVIDEGYFSEIVAKSTPEAISLSDYIHLLEQSLSAKIEIQQRISDELTHFSKFGILDREKAQALYEESRAIEAKFYAYGGLLKRFLDYYIEKLSYLNMEDQKLLITPSEIPAQVEKEFLMSSLAMTSTSSDRSIQAATEIFYNGDERRCEEELRRYKERGRDYLDAQVVIYKKFQNDTKRKNQFLIERKIRYAKEIDYLLNFDNRTEKMFDYKKCFLHDVFLKLVLDQTEDKLGRVEISEATIRRIIETSS